MSNMQHLRLRTERLELIAGTLELACLEIDSVPRLAAALSCDPPESWPPPLNDENSQRWFRNMLECDPTAVGWGAWYIVLAEAGAPRRLIGNGGFKGRPGNGVCEIGYSLLPSYQGHGCATEASRAWIDWAFTHPEVGRVAAQTLPELIGSIRVMEKCGMHFVGEGEEDGQRTVRYEIARER